VTVRIAVLSSQNAPGAAALLRDPACGPIYDISAVVSVGRDVDRPPRNLRDREEYDLKLLRMFGGADFLFLDNYRYLVTRPLLDAFPGRIIVVHDGDLTVTANGRRSYTGLHAVRNAILSGDTVTRATAFVATEEPGEGPLLLLGPAFAVSQLASSAVARGIHADFAVYAHLHRQWMVRESYGVMLRKVAELVSLGTMHVAKDTVWVDGVPGPCRLGEAPEACWSAVNPPRRGIPSSCPFIRTEVFS
jgi:folate-dependent phosphoribosylglycinamide formyltransferase PurN